MISLSAFRRHGMMDATMIAGGLAVPTQKERPMAKATRALSVLALLAMSACAADAQTFAAGGKPPELTPGPQCSPQQRQMVDEAIVEARRRLATAITFVQTRPEDPYIRRWFGEGQNNLVLKNLQTTQQRLNQSQQLTIHCNDPQTCRGQFAYARRSANLLGLCRPFFQARFEGQDNRWGIIIHEVTHLAALTGDYAYQPRGAQALAKSDPSRAARNADNYEYFVEFLPR